MDCVDDFSGFHIVANLYALVASFEKIVVEAVIGLEAGSKDDAVTRDFLGLTFFVDDHDAVI